MLDRPKITLDAPMMGSCFCTQPLQGQALAKAENRRPALGGSDLSRRWTTFKSFYFAQLGLLQASITCFTA